MLTDKAVKALKPREKQYKESDERGLYVLVTPTGSKLWRLKYRYAGKEKTLSMGQYPEVSLADAREIAINARRSINQGEDPSENKKRAKTRLIERHANTFAEVAKAWHKRESMRWAPPHADRVWRDVNRDLISPLKDIPVADITTKDLLSVVKEIEERGAIDVASRAQQRLTAILRYAVQHGLIEHNPGVNLRGVIVKPTTQHRQAISTPEVGELVSRINSYTEEGGKELTQLALKLTLLTFLRSTEIRAARWSEINFKERTWTIPGIRDAELKNGGMKSRKDHVVPLSDQAIEVLNAVKALDLSNYLVFPIRVGSKEIMSENTMNHALNRMGYKGRQTVHGFRTIASTILNQGDRKNKWNKDAIERQLAHSAKSDDAVRDAYNRYEYIEERTEMMQWYADRLDLLEKQSAKVVPLRRA